MWRKIKQKNEERERENAKIRVKDTAGKEDERS